MSYRYSRVADLCRGEMVYSVSDKKGGPAGDESMYKLLRDRLGINKGHLTVIGSRARLSLQALLTENDGKLVHLLLHS